MSSINELSYLYENISTQEYLSLDSESEYFDQELADLVENIISTISFNMINEGYSAEGIIDFLENTSEQEIIEYYFNLPILDENFVLDESTLVEFSRLEEALGSALKLLSRGLKPAGRLIKVATKRSMGPGVRKKLASATTKVKDVASKTKANIPSKEKFKSGAKTALGLGAATLAGYAGGRLAGGRDEKTTPVDTKTPTAPPKSEKPSKSSETPSTPSQKSSSASGGDAKTSPSKSSKDSDKGPAGETPMQKWARLHPKLAAKVKPGQSGYEEISAKREKPGSNEKQDQTPTTGNPEAKIDPKEVEASIKAQQEREKKKMESSTKKESYDAFDVVLDYLFETNQVDTLAEASYVMMEMDSDAIQSIVLEKAGYLADEYNLIVEGLIAEGYDLSEYTEDEFIDMLIAENILPALGKLIVGINKARGAVATAAKSPATKQLGKTVKKAASDFGKGFMGSPKAKGGALVKSPSAALTKAGKPGALVKSPKGALTSGTKGGKMVDASVKPVNVKDVTKSATSAAGGKGGGLVGGGSAGGGGGKGGALVASPKGAMTKAGGKGGALVAAGPSGGGGKGPGASGAGGGRGRKGLAALGLGAAGLGAGMLASQGRDKKTSPRRQEALVGSQNAEKPLTASPNNMAVAKDVNKQGGVALGKGGLGYLAKKGDKMVVKQAKAVGADDGVIGKAARVLGLTKAKDKAIEAQRQSVGRANREKYLSGQGLTDKNITGYQAKGAKRKGETTGTKIKMDNN
jgi:hypothetical protein